MTNLRDFARDKPCQIRIAGICCDHAANHETTVLAHFRILGASGMGLKPPDVLGAHACFACHAYVDTHRDVETQLDFARGVIRTQSYLVSAGVLSWERPASAAVISRLREAADRLVAVVKREGSPDAPTSEEWFEALSGAITCIAEAA